MDGNQLMFDGLDMLRSELQVLELLHPDFEFRVSDPGPQYNDDVVLLDAHSKKLMKHCGMLLTGEMYSKGANLKVALRKMSLTLRVAEDESVK